MTALSAAQLKRLQVPYAQYARRSLELDSSRDCRIAWAGQQLGHAVESFGTLSKEDAHTLINLLQGAMGIPQSKPRRRARRDDKAAGLEGRATGSGTAALSNTVTLPTAQDLDRINDALTRLGWNTAQYEAWLRSLRSPLARTIGTTRIAPSDITLRTLRDTNRVWWALKGMLKGRGLWK